MIMNYISTTTTTSRPMRLAEPLITTATNHNSSSTSSSSTWQQLMVGAGSAAGSTAAVVSEESMKCLKYCLSWLQYAIRHLSQQMGLIRSFLVSLATSPQQPKQPQILASIKNDMVTTLRKVIDIITCYASNALPYQAKATVRGAILSLPSRWASLNDDTSTATTTGTTTTNSCNVTQRQTKGQEEVALRLLAFGQESTEMLTSIHTIFDDTVQRAESWLERLRVLNPMSYNSNNDNSIQLPPPLNNNNNAADTTSNKINDDDDEFYNVLLPPIRNLHISSSTSTTTSQSVIPSS